MYKDNPEKDQDRAKDCLEIFEQIGDVMYIQNLKVYKNIAIRVTGKKVLEAGCGMGKGSYLLSEHNQVMGTDKLEKNINFAKALYEKIYFDRWDLNGESYPIKHDVVVCVETIEHVENWKRALANLIDSAKEEVWISTPNRNVLNKEGPDNPYHVHEFETKEMVDLIILLGENKIKKIEILHWDSFSELSIDTNVHPIVYHICLN